MEIYVHIGLHKTASTFLQSTLFPSLSECCFLTRKDLLTFKQYVLHEGDFTFDPVIGRKMFLRALDAKDNLEKSKIIISDEDFSGMPFMGAIDRKRNIDRLLEIFSEYELKIIVLLRNQENLFKSLYLQYVKTGGSVSLINFLKSSSYPLVHNNNYYHFSSFLDYLKSKVSLSNMCVLLFEEFIDNKPVLVDQLRNFIDVKSADIDLDVTKNVSLGSRFIGPMIFVNSITRSYKNIHGLLPFKFYRLYTYIFLRLSSLLPKKVFLGGLAEEDLRSLKVSNLSLVEFIEIGLLLKYKYIDDE